MITLCPGSGADEAQQPTCLHSFAALFLQRIISLTACQTILFVSCRGKGIVSLGDEELSVIELEMMQDMDRNTRVGQRLEGNMLPLLYAADARSLCFAPPMKFCMKLNDHSGSHSSLQTAELTFRRIIVFVALLVMLLPAMEAPYGLWGKYNVSAGGALSVVIAWGIDQGGLRMLHELAVNQGPNNTSWMEPPGHRSAFGDIFDTALQHTNAFHTDHLNANMHMPLCQSMRIPSQAFQTELPFKVGPRYTSYILSLTIKNETFFEEPPGLQRRHNELFFQSLHLRNWAALSSLVWLKLFYPFIPWAKGDNPHRQ
eukprot:scaffold1819_cov18-Tisochrysis_lutea.AAC.1